MFQDLLISTQFCKLKSRPHDKTRPSPVDVQITQAVLLGELELAWRQHARSAFEPGELRNYVNAEHIPIGAVIQAW
jgi:hypothetical protein